MAKKKATTKAAAKKAVTKKTVKKAPAKKKAATKAASPQTAAPKTALSVPAAHVQDGRRLRIPVTKFCKPGYEISEEGDESVQIKVKVPDGNSGGAGCSGDSALEFFGKKRLRIRFSRRGVGEWGQGQIVEDGPGQIFDCETEVASFGWTNGDFHFAFWTDRISFESAKSMYRKAGSIEVQVIGEPVESDGAPASPSGKPKKPPKAAPPAKPKGPTIPGTTPEELADNHSVALTENFRVDLKIVAMPEGKFSCQWSGEGPGGDCGEGEPSVRNSSTQAAISSVGKAVDEWAAYPGDEEQEVVGILREWLRRLELGETPAGIEADLAEDEEDDEEDDEE